MNSSYNLFKNKYRVLGVMSGTSLDGVDVVLVNFWLEKNKWKFKIEISDTLNYDSKWQERLAHAHHLSPKKLDELDHDYSLKLYEILSDFILKHSVGPVDAICSHGHTVLHEPDKGFTVQIGNQNLLSEMLGCTLICDFRVQDVENGGQGAPLVPVGDYLLFSDYSAAMNLGGFANLTRMDKDLLNAHDICALNTVINRLVTRENLKFDDKGQLASQGKIIQELLEELDNIAYYQVESPKSLGIENVEKDIWPLILKYPDHSTKDLLATYVEHVSKIIALEIGGAKSVLVTGGGAFNTFLIESIKKYAQSQLVIPDKTIVEYKEAIVFGLLGILRLRQENNIYASVTGCLEDHCSGKIYRPALAS
ncbi:MAG: anhydro-N-acetylmuramic acid kinase [Flavobacteriaceae bacterium]|nr:anhydro-N-acetylmuramic acid kinase [Flavobacteriaceae bacterium]